MAGGFEELRIWQQAHQLTLRIYKLTTSWPKSEMYGLISQVRRAASSVELNIAEGQSRYHDNETIHFLFTARGSAEETRNCLLLARDLEEFELSSEDFHSLDEEYSSLVRGINGFIAHFRNKKLIT